MNNLDRLIPYAEEYNRSVDGIMDRVRSLNGKVRDGMQKVNMTMTFALYDSSFILGNIVMLADYYEKDVLQIIDVKESGECLDITYGLKDYSPLCPQLVKASYMAHIPLELLSGDVDRVASSVLDRYFDGRVRLLEKIMHYDREQIAKLSKDLEDMESELELIRRWKAELDITEQ